MKKFVIISIFLFISFSTFTAQSDELPLRDQLFSTIHRINSTVSNLEKGVSDLNDRLNHESNILIEIQHILNSANTPETSIENVLPYINGTYKQISQLESSIADDLKIVHNDQRQISIQIANIPKCIDNSNKLNCISESIRLVQDKLEAKVNSLEAMQKTLEQFEKVQEAQQKIQRDQTEILNAIIVKLDSQNENIAKIESELSKISQYIGAVKESDNNVANNSIKQIPYELLMKLGMTSVNNKP